MLTSPFPEKKARRICLRLMEQLDNEKTFSPGTGLMIGVLCCDDSDGNRVVLKAFSGQYDGSWELPGWVGPAFDVDKFWKIADEADRKIKSGMLGAEECRTVSRKAQEDIFALYEFHCADGRIISLQDVFQNRGFPGGTGDCCEIKLLNHAFRNHLQPVSMAQFFYGQENPSGNRKHGEFYSPCDEKCVPILREMLGLDILYLDQDIVVVNKPAGLLSVPGKGEDKQDCVVSRVRRLYPWCVRNPAAHRLDMDTSGLLVLGLTENAHRQLSMQFEGRQVKKKYIAVLDGILKYDSGRMELPFRLDPENRPYQVYDPVNGRMGVTLWRRLRVYDGMTRVEFTPLTGRTHQLRIHSASPKGLGIPIVGDRLYGTRTEGQRLLLHAGYLQFVHPGTGKTMCFEVEAPF
ncbi:MAG: RluA family pseudouridine synthase [Spirochaetia bacterium]|nr:RluA family pseudouridine synthase [Spirochaetia bacterium]